MATDRQRVNDVREAVERHDWTEVIRLVHSSDCPDERHWSIEQLVTQAPEWFVNKNIDAILDDCDDDRLSTVLSHLLTRRLWRGAGHVMERDISSAQHRLAVDEALKHANDFDFFYYILPHCLNEELEQGLNQLVSRGLWMCVGDVMQRDISSGQHRLAVDEAMKHADHLNFFNYILPHCLNEELEQGLTHLLSRGMWWSVGKVLERGISTTQHTWAVQEALKHACEGEFTDCMLHHFTDEELEQVLTHMVSRGLWKPVDSVTHSDVSVTQHILSQIVSQGLWKAVGRFLQRQISREQHRWAVEQAIEHADDDDFVRCILPQCHDEQLEHVLFHLVSRGLWDSVSKTLERGASITQHRWAVTEALKHADEREFVDCILHHFSDEELEEVLTHMVSRDLWKPVDSVTHSDVSVTEHILSQIVSQGLWEALGRFLQRDISQEQHRWAVEQASRHALDHIFVQYIFPQCHDEELKYVIAHLVPRGLWESVGKVLDRGVGTMHYRWAVEEALKHAYEWQFAYYILDQCADEELEQVLTHMVSRGLWKPVDSVTHSDVSVTQHILSQLVSRGLWEAVGRFMQRDSSSEQYKSAVQQASRHASDDVFVQYILPECHDEDLEHTVTHLVSRGLWKSVGKVLERDIRTTRHKRAIERASTQAGHRHFIHYILPQCHDEDLERVTSHLVSQGSWMLIDKVLERGVSTAHHRWAVEEAMKHADEKQFVHYILHHCTDEGLEQVLTHMVSRGLWKPVDSVTHSDVSVTQHILLPLMSQGLWKAVGRFLHRDISNQRHRWAVEQASRHAGDDDFVHCILPHCHNEELDHVLGHLVSRGLWMSVGKALERGASATQHRQAVVWAAKHADDVSFDLHIMRHCSEDDVLSVFPLLVQAKKWRCTQHVLYDMVRDTLYTWMTSGQDNRAHDTLFWKFIHHCHIEVSLALDLSKAMTQRNTWMNHDYCEGLSYARFVLGWCVSWQTEVCESLMTTLLHTLCYVMCSDAREYTDSTDHTKQCVSDIYTHITSCIKDNTKSMEDNILKTIKNNEQWTPVFTEIADSYKTDPLFLLHFLQGLSLYQISRRGENDDAILLVMLAVFPLFPQLQSVALRMMLRDKRWDVIKKACLSHVWEHDRRRLFKAAVMQRQWSVVRQWSDHTVHDDQREWAMKEAFKEEEWEVYLLLADHGLTMPEQMHAHYMVAKYADWDTVLQMVERGGDITEVSNLLENWVTRNLRKKPEDGDVPVYMKRCEKLIRTRLRFAKHAVRSPMKALERCKWGSVLFNILHEPTENYFSRVLDKVIEEQQWHILMHLVRLGMNKAERDWLFPQMVRQQQWGVCRMLLEHGVDDQLCVGALPELMERNQWTLVARVMEYNVDDAVRRQVMQCAFQRREGALFWHCLTTMKDKQQLSMETQGKLFYQAISRDIWQAVKPLMVEKDGPTIQHRDMAFLEAIEQHLWDVVDYCQLYRADINMKDENGETPLHREARKEEWIAVKEIVLRDGKPNLLDKDGVSVLNRLIKNEQWDTVKIVIMYGGDIHLPASCHESRGSTHTPLQALITARQADVIQFSIMWCGDQKKGMNGRGETCFHAVCDSDRRWDVMEDLIVRKVDPLAVTKTGKSPLVYAVLNEKCPERMVAECSKLGFSSHQPSVTGPQESVFGDIIHTVFRMWSLSVELHCDYVRLYSEITSPLVCAVLCDLPVVVLMLYESASCSKTELVTLYTQLPKLTDMNAAEGRRLHEEVLRTTQQRPWVADDIQQKYSRFTHSIEKHTALLRELYTTPRTLRSSCRLLILQHFHFSDTKRHQKLDVLPLSEPLKNYLEYSDLCDPDYGSEILW